MSILRQHTLIIEQLEKVQTHAACPWSFSHFFSLDLHQPQTPCRGASSTTLARTCSLLFTHRLDWVFDILLECGCGLAFLTWFFLFSSKLPMSIKISPWKRPVCMIETPFSFLIWPSWLQMKIVAVAIPEVHELKKLERKNKWSSSWRLMCDLNIKW